MDMTGSYQINAPRERVWTALLDPEILKASIPGCLSVEKLNDTDYTATVVAKIGPMKANFKGKITMSDFDPPHSFKMSGEGSGGVAGFAKGGAVVKLDQAEGGTLLSYEVNATVGGKMAQMGQRLIDSVAQKMASDFFEAFSRIAGEGVVEAVELPAPPAEAAKKPFPGNINPWLIAGGGGIIVILLLWMKYGH